MGEIHTHNGDRSDAGAPRKGSHEVVIALRKNKVKTGEVARQTGYTPRRVQQIWSAHLQELKKQMAPISSTETGPTDDKPTTGKPASTNQVDSITGSGATGSASL